MTSNIEKKLNINIIITMGITIFTIIGAIISLNNVINKIVDLKKTNIQIAVNVLKISEISTEKESIVKDIILNHNDKSYVKKNSKKYRILLKDMNSIMSLTEKLLGEKSVSHDLANIYIKLYKVIVENTKSEKKVLNYIAKDNFPEAMKEFKIKNKRYKSDIDEISNIFYSMATTDTQKIDSFEREHFLIIVIVNILAFLAFIVLSSLILSKLSKNLSKLHNAAKNIQQGNLETPVEIDANDEIGELAIALDRLRQSLNKSNKMVNRKRV